MLCKNNRGIFFKPFEYLVFCTQPKINRIFENIISTQVCYYKVSFEETSNLRKRAYSIGHYSLFEILLAWHLQNCFAYRNFYLCHKENYFQNLSNFLVTVISTALPPLILKITISFFIQIDQKFFMEFRLPAFESFLLFLIKKLLIIAFLRRHSLLIYLSFYLAICLLHLSTHFHRG